MTIQFSTLKWRPLLLATVVVYLISFLFIFIVIFGYAFLLGFQARGAPDPGQITQFANQVGPWAGRLGVVALTAAAAAWIARRVETAPQLHGLLLGVLTGLPNLIIGHPLSLAGLVTLALAILAGWGGSRLAQKSK